MLTEPACYCVKHPERDSPGLSEEGVLVDADFLAELVGEEGRCTLGIQPPHTWWVQRRGEM